MTRRTSPSGRVHIEAGDHVRTWKGTGTVRMIGPVAPPGVDANYTWAIVEMDDGHARLTFDLNALELDPVFEAYTLLGKCFEASFERRRAPPGPLTRFLLWVTAALEKKP